MSNVVSEEPRVFGVTIKKEFESNNVSSDVKNVIGNGDSHVLDNGVVSLGGSGQHIISATGNGSYNSGVSVLETNHSLVSGSGEESLDEDSPPEISVSIKKEEGTGAMTSVIVKNFVDSDRSRVSDSLEGCSERYTSVSIKEEHDMESDAESFEESSQSDDDEDNVTDSDEGNQNVASKRDGDNDNSLGESSQPYTSEGGSSCINNSNLSNGLSMYAKSNLSDGDVVGSSAPKQKKTYECEVCHRVFRKNGNLKVHMQIHSDERPFGCDLCEKRFRLKAHLQSHEVSHTRDRSFWCGVCGKGYSRAEHLKRHMTSHLDEKSYVCTECGKTFTRNDRLRIHIKRIHKHDKCHKCDICGENFGRPIDLRRHVNKTHSEIKQYRCDVCGRAFSQSGSLTIHKRLHTDERPFKCDECDKSFRHVGALSAHKTVHTKETPYKCDECGKRYKADTSLRRHRRDVHYKERMMADV